MRESMSASYMGQSNFGKSIVSGQTGERRKRMNKIIFIACLCSVFLAQFATFARADESSERAFGFRVGYGTDPDQFVVGLQFDTGKITRFLHFVPSFDAGFGDHCTTLSLNGDLKLFVPLPKSSVVFYALAGPAMTMWLPEEGDRDTDVGVNAGLGARMELGDSGWYNLETRFGFGDVPEWRILFGVLFGNR